MKYKRDLSKPLAPTYGDDDKKKKSGKVKLVKGKGNVVHIDTTGYSEGKESFPYRWSRTSPSFQSFGQTKTETGKVGRKMTDDMIRKYQNPSHKSIMNRGNKGIKKASTSIASKMLKRFKRD